MRDTHEKFSLKTIGLHWIIAIAMIGLLAFGLYLEDMPRGPEKFQLIGWHKALGVLVLVLAIYRLGWRSLNGFPKPVGNYASWEHLLAKIVHLFLLLGTIFMPVSGMMMSIAGGYGINVFGLELVPVLQNAPGFEKNEILGETGRFIHGLGGKLLILAIFLHIAGAFKHHLIDKDGTLRRMLGKSL